MIIVFSPNGMNMESWNLKQDAGQIKELSQTLMALQEYQKDIIVYGGLAQTKARANGDGGGELNGNKYIIHPKETPLNNLWLGLLHHIGVHIPEIELGDSTGIIQVVA